MRIANVFFSFLAAATLYFSAMAPVIAKPSPSPLEQAVQASDQTRVPVLMYHYIDSRNRNEVSDAEINSNWNWITVYHDQFAAQMNWLYQNGYDVISLADLETFRETGKIKNPKSVVLTFDDDWFAADNRWVIPAMKRYGFIASLAVITDYVGNYWSDLKKWEQEGLADVESHSRHHYLNPPMTLMPTQIISDEVFNSKRAIEEKLGKNVVAFVVPGGIYDSRVLQQSDAAGYRMVVTTEQTGPVTYGSSSKIPRFAVQGTMSLDDFIQTVSKNSTSENPNGKVIGEGCTPDQSGKSWPQIVGMQLMSVTCDVKDSRYYGKPILGVN